MTGKRNPKVDAYIQKAQPFAKPVLEHLRELMHKAIPTVEEVVKWSRPFFEYKGEVIGYMAGFKEHCTFGFWGKEMAQTVLPAKDGAHGPLDRITSLKDFDDKQLLGWMREAGRRVDEGTHTSPLAARSQKEKKPPVAAEVPEDFEAALEKNKRAAAAFAAFSPSCKREYVEWITEAKRAETRAKRIATALEWIAEGKQRHWKYQAS